MILQGSKDRKSASGWALAEERQRISQKRRPVFYSKSKPDYSSLTTLIRVKKNVIGR